MNGLKAILATDSVTQESNTLCLIWNMLLVVYHKVQC